MSRVEVAKNEKEDLLRQAFTEKGFQYPPERIFLRAFKHEKELEIFTWHKNRFQLFKKYSICQTSGKLGPKRQEGDGQVPEGFYEIDRFNEVSRFYLSLGLNYPNQADRILGDPQQPGSDIFIHGDCVSIGCLAMTDDLIKEIFWLAYQLKGGAAIQVHIYPYRFDDHDMAKLMKDNTLTEQVKPLWLSLQKAYDYFNKNGQPAPFSVEGDGQYRVEGF